MPHLLFVLFFSFFLNLQAVTSIKPAGAGGGRPTVEVEAPSSSRIIADAFFETKSSPAGPVYLYHLKIKGTQSEFEGKIPNVDGLVLKSRRTERSFRNINGKYQTEVNFIYVAHRLEDRDFLIPAYEIRVDGQTVVVPQAKLLVDRDGDGHDRDQAARTVWIELVLPKNALYTAEAVPFEVRLYRRGDIGLSVNSAAPELINEGFSVPLYGGRYSEDQTRIQGVGFSVYTWKGSTTALKSGVHSLQFNFPVVATLANPMQDPFDILMGMGLSRGESHELLLQTPPQAIEVKPLPEAGRPASFCGAVGEFTFEAQLETPKLTQGEPTTLRVAISGEGSLEHVFAPPLPLGAGWKQYPPKTELRSKDATASSGTKIFEYILVPLDANLKSFPELQWAYFSPSRAQYQELIAPERPIEVQPAHSLPAAAPPSTPRPAPQAPPAQAAVPTSPAPLEAPEYEPLPLKLSLGDSTHSLLPLAKKPWFWPAHAAALLLYTALAKMLLKKKKASKDPQILRKRSLKEQLKKGEKQLQQALKAHDSKEFFTQACALLQTAAAIKLKNSPEALTPEAIVQHAQNLKIPAQLQATLHLCLDQQEALKYGAAATAQHHDLALCYTQLKALIASFSA